MKLFLNRLPVFTAILSMVVASCNIPDDEPTPIPPVPPVTPTDDVTVRLSASSHIEANVSISNSTSFMYYGGFLLIAPGVDKADVAQMFLDDASSVIKGFDRTTIDTGNEEVTNHVYVAGSYGKEFDSNYSGKLSAFVPHDSGDNQMENNILKPGAEYAVGVILFERDTDEKNLAFYESLSTSDVIVKYVKLDDLKQTASSYATIAEDSKTTNSVTAKLSYTNSVSRAYFTAQKKSEYEARTIEDEVEYAIYKGGEWDRTATKISGAYESTSIVSLLKDGEEAVFTTVAIDNSGRCQFAKLILSPDKVEKGDGTLAFTSHSSEKINENAVRVDFTFEANGIASIRILNEKTLSAFNEYYHGSEAEVFTTLTTGNMWDYETIQVSENPYSAYIAPEAGEEYILWAVGVDSNNRFTELVRYGFEL